MVTRRDANATMKLVYTGSEVLASRRNLSVRLPDVFVLPGLGCRVPWSRTETFVVRESPDGVLEQIMERAQLGLVRV